MSQAFDLGIVNTFCNELREHLPTYRSGGTVIDYFMVRRENLRELKKLLSNTGDRMLVMEMKAVRKVMRRIVHETERNKHGRGS